MFKTIAIALLTLALGGAGYFAFTQKSAYGNASKEVAALEEKIKEAEKKEEEAAEELKSTEEALQAIPPLEAKVKELEAVKGAFASGAILKDLEALYAKDKKLSTEKQLGLAGIRMLTHGGKDPSTIEAFITLYENTIDEKWLITARNLANYTFDHFFDERSKMFFFTSNEDDALVTRSIEYRDNVIPASNSIMAKNLFKLSHYFDNEHYRKTALTMLNNVKPEIKDYASGYSNWLDLMLNYTNPFYEIAIVGKESSSKILEINKSYLPNKLIAGSITDKNLPLLENRYVPNKTFIYVCVYFFCLFWIKFMCRTFRH